MKVCYRAGAVTACDNYYSIAADVVEIRLWFMADDILRIRAGFDRDWDEASYALNMTAWESRTDELMAPDVDSEFVMYDDDGKSNDYKKGQYLKTCIAVTAGTRTYIRFSHEGEYPTTIETMHLDVIHREKAPFFVRIDGQEIPHFLHRRKFEDAEIGWYYSQSLKSVQVKYPNPKKDHEVMISFEVFDMIGM